jgi:hypothetical protein
MKGRGKNKRVPWVFPAPLGDGGGGWAAKKKKNLETYIPTKWRQVHPVNPIRSKVMEFSNGVHIYGTTLYIQRKT